ncbi:MAG: hypothetical protein ILA24_01490 [Ruminococcus sp.]|nr:hypothetical protein [Ruminococcus sp.]
MKLGEIFETAVEDYRIRQKEKSKWGTLFVFFILLSVGATLIKEIMVKGADYLGGKATVEKFFRANLVRFVIMCLLMAVFIVVFVKTWNGRQSSIEQLVFSFGAGIVVIFFAVTALMPVLTISDELKHPRTAELHSYTLCTDTGGNYYVGFDDNGGVLLNIPKDKYEELSRGKSSDNAAGFAYDEIVESGKYKNIVFYRCAVQIVYYHHSVIYENVSLASQ